MNIYGEFQEKLCLFRNYLLEEERSAATIEKYGRDVLAFLSWLSDREEISKEVVVGYKQAIIGKYKTTSANSMLVSVNRFLDFIGKKDCQVKLFKIQRNPFRKKDKELTKEEYNRLILAAKAKSSSRLFLMIQAICSTGIRVSEHRFITRERKNHYLQQRQGARSLSAKEAEKMPAPILQAEWNLLRTCFCHQKWYTG